MRNWAGNFEYQAARIHRPSTVAEVQAIVRGAERVKAIGTRHCFNRIADTTGDLVSLEGFGDISPVDRETMTVTIGAGVNYGTLAPRLHTEGFALANLASLPHISVVGAAMTGTHGSGVANQCLSAAVCGLEFVNGRGDLVSLRRGDSDFEGAVVSLGALGIVTSLTLDVIPTFEVGQVVYDDLTFESAFAHFEAVMANAYSVSLFTDWQARRFNQVWVKATDARAWPDRFYGALAADGMRHPVPGMPPENCTDQFGARGPWMDRLPHFRLDHTPSGGVELQTEFFVERKNAVAALEALWPLSHEIAPLLLITEVRTIAADDLWLSPAYRRDSVAIHFTWKQEDGVYAMIPRIEAALADFAPRPHWGKLFAMGADTLASRYPRFADFNTLVDKYDPGRKFDNEYLRSAIASM